MTTPAQAPVRRAWRRCRWGLVALATAVTGLAIQTSSPAGAYTIEAVLATAGAHSPAVRLSQLPRTTTTAPTTTAPVGPTSGGSLLFPMNPSPRCYVLDNFADARSGGTRSHQGEDIMATLGQEVYAVVDGTLNRQILDNAGSLSGNAWYLTSATGPTYYFYAHLSTFAPGLAVGSQVKKGDVIAYTGDTGNPGAGNYHLHFEVHPGGGAAVDPLPLLAIPAACKVYGA